MIEEISANLFKIEMFLPDSPLKSVNSYVIKGAERALIVDTGINREECLKKMQAGLTELGIDLRKTDFFITHLHADHLGLVSYLATEDSKTYINEFDAIGIEFFDRHQDKFLHFARSNGFPEDELQALFSIHPGYRYRSRDHFSFTFLKEGDEIDVGKYSFRCVETPGHTQGHMCLYEKNRKVLLGGDHILKGITPNIQVWSDEWNPLKEYLGSLDKVYQLDIELVLPGHGRVFKNYKDEIDELRSHYEERLSVVLSLLGKKGLTAYQTASRMHWDSTDMLESWDGFPTLQKWFATGEVIVHLNYLHEKGMVRKQTRGRDKIFSLNVNHAA